MTFDQYQEDSKRFAKFPTDDERVRILYLATGLNGEAGEVADKIKKIVRDKGCVTLGDRAPMAKEIGDVLWYLSQLASEFQLDLSRIARENIEKLESRMARNKISGSGDNR